MAVVLYQGDSNPVSTSTKVSQKVADKNSKEYESYELKRIRQRIEFLTSNERKIPYIGLQN